MRGFRTSRPARASRASRFDALLRPHLRSLYRVAYRYTGKREDAEDLVQDLLTKLYPRTDELESVEDLEPWLLRSLYNAFIDRVRKQQRSPRTVDHHDAEAASVVDVHQDVSRMEQRAALDSAIAGLTPEHRAVVMLHLVEGYPLPELAAMLQVQIGTLKSRLHRAKRQLRAALDPVEPNPPRERVREHEL